MTKTKTIGGKFMSTGKAEDHQSNKALITRMMGEIGMDGEAMLPLNDRLFLGDTRDKLSSKTANMFGWRQVEEVVRIHTLVQAARLKLDPAQDTMLNAPPFTRALAQVMMARAQAIVKHGPLKSGTNRWERLISEEYQEVMDELASLFHYHRPEEIARAIGELAQLAQLCMGAIELLQQGKVEEE